MGSVPSFVNSFVSNNRLSGLSKRMFNNITYVVILDLSCNEITNSIQDMIQELSYKGLNILLLKGNHFTWNIPKKLCELVDLSTLDLSHTNFSGAIPNCLGKMPFEIALSLKAALYGFVDVGIHISEKADFTTKQRSYTYTGDILAYMSGVDLSCDILNGSIPFELGNLSRIQALNLSHNDLTGQIPATFANFVQSEGLDLSFNMLSRQIPPQLSKLSSREVFSVAHNSLSGETTERRGHLITFDESSYKGNLLLCGPPLPKSCYPYGQPLTISQNGSNIDGDDAV